MGVRVSEPHTCHGIVVPASDPRCPTCKLKGRVFKLEEDVAELNRLVSELLTTVAVMESKS